MATHAKKAFKVDEREARYTGLTRRAFGSALHEVEFHAGDRRGEKIWVRRAPTAAQTRERLKREAADRRDLRKKAASLQGVPAVCQPGTVHLGVSAFPQRHRAKDAAPPEPLADVVRRQGAEEEEHERRALDPTDDYPPVPSRRRLQHAAGRGGRRAQPPVGTTYTRVFRGQEVRCQVVAEDAENGETLLGFRVGPKTFRSLTAAAESLTGYPVSGPVFWGLR